ncbi:MAG: hypothetical protein HY761_11575 [Candidatus Omnitrophica bacterium]|nr:hypothetical protein [Candidatus Omnitrophota bacterium]
MHAKRIILMYISDVSGHRSAAYAIENAIKMLQPDTEILNINAFNYTNPISEKIINSLYMGVIKVTPQIWDYLYDNPKVVKKLEKIKKTIHKLNSPKFKTLFERFKPDAIICTQAFPCGMVADFKKTYNSNIPLIAVLTDFIPHAYWVYDTVDYYITPSDDISSRLIEKGVRSDKIRPLGIPFSHKFIDKVNKQELINKFKLNQNLATILIMGGGQGLGPIKRVVNYLEKVREPIQEIVVCGTNKKLYNSLKRKIDKFKKKIFLFGYAQNVNELMTVSDMIITKPGGVTTAEVLAKNLPMIIIKPIPGQEANNALYLTSKNAAIKVDKPREITGIVENLLQNPAKLSTMSKSIDIIKKPQASIDIAKLVLELPNV